MKRARWFAVCIVLSLAATALGGVTVGGGVAAATEICNKECKAQKKEEEKKELEAAKAKYEQAKVAEEAAYGEAVTKLDEKYKCKTNKKGECKLTQKREEAKGKALERALKAEEAADQKLLTEYAANVTEINKKYEKKKKKEEA